MALDDLFAHKKVLDEYLTEFLTEKISTLGGINSWGTESVTRLLPFITAGKSVRGCLALFSYNMFAKTGQIKIALPIAAGLELIHAGALIHDDIMDQDNTRRHMKAMHKQFDEFSNDVHFGESMAINIGDLCFFLAFEQLSKIISPNLSGLLSLASQEFASVTVAQQFDVASSYLSHKSCEEEIISLYRNKTARYTFSLPLIMGGLLANTAVSTLNILELLGESMGILFQIRDDELSVIGDMVKTGKPIGSDEKNKKQTLIHLYLQEENTTDYPKSTAFIRIQKIMNRYQDLARQSLEKLPVDTIYKQTLQELILFCSTREK